jgi:hypothetical protein
LIFKYFELYTLTPLGITFEKFYEIHAKIHGTLAVFYKAVAMDG